MPEAAFNKGVDWFTEIIFFYGIMFGIVFYEMNKSLKSSRAIQKHLDEVYKKN